VPPANPRDILEAGPDALGRLPTADELARCAVAERRLVLDDLRAELYRVASVLVDRCLRRAWARRDEYPPYGLVRSLFSQLRVVAADPRPFEAGSITGFEGLGRAVLDTVVFHLERDLAGLRTSEHAWLPARLEQLLALYRSDADRAAQARIRDPFSFVYGGVHFGTSVCVQMVEAMTRRLAGSGLAAAEKEALMGRSIRVLYQLAAVNLDDLPALYQTLLAPSSPWFDLGRLTLAGPDGRPDRIDIVLPPQNSGGRHRYQTRGCPARSSPSGGPGGIAILWNWCTELGVATGLVPDG
jgi:hypothetical protein